MGAGGGRSEHVWILSPDRQQRRELAGARYTPSSPLPLMTFLAQPESGSVQVLVMVSRT
jgi:hypothetical protein